VKNAHSNPFSAACTPFPPLLTPNFLAPYAPNIYCHKSNSHTINPMCSSLRPHFRLPLNCTPSTLCLHEPPMLPRMWPCREDTVGCTWRRLGVRPIPQMPVSRLPRWWISLCPHGMDTTDRSSTAGKSSRGGDGGKADGDLAACVGGGLEYSGANRGQVTRWGSCHSSPFPSCFLWIFCLFWWAFLMQPLNIDLNFFFNWTWYNFFVLQFVFVLFPLSAPLYRFRFSLFFGCPAQLWFPRLFLDSLDPFSVQVLSGRFQCVHSLYNSVALNCFIWLQIKTLKDAYLSKLTELYQINCFLKFRR
jgi:hypothetical protein